MTSQMDIGNKWKPLIRGGIIAIFVGLAIFLGIKYLWPRQHQEVVEAEPVEEIHAVQVVSKTLFREDQLPGEIHAYQDVAIYPKVPGFVKWIGVDRGSVVKKGQLMVTMFAPEYIARRDEASAKVSSAKASLSEGESKLESAKSQLLEAKAKWLGDDSTYVRLKSASLVPGVVASNDVIVLGQTVAVDKERVDTWQHNVAATQNEVASLKENLAASQKSLADFSDFASYLQVTAPFDGYITERNMHVGSFVGPLGSGAYPPIVRIQQLNLLRIVAPVPERDTAGVLPGAPVDFSVSTFPDRRFTGTVARLGNYLEQKTRTMPVELNYPNPDNHILPGMFCKVYWPTRRPQPSLFVPVTAVVETTLHTFMCRIKNGEVEQIKVIKGQTMDNLVEVFGDLKEGDVVAAYASEELETGTKVKPLLVSHGEVEKLPSRREPYHYPQL